MDLDIGFDFGVLGEAAAGRVFMFAAVDVSGDSVASFEGFRCRACWSYDGPGVVTANCVVVARLGEPVAVFLGGTMLGSVVMEMDLRVLLPSL